MLAATVDTLYTVKAGDSLSKLAQEHYGNPAHYTLIAQRNGLAPTSILMIGQRIILPATTPTNTVAPGIYTPSALPASPGGSDVVTYDNDTIETVTTTAAVWYKDWRYWAAIGVGVSVIWYVGRKLRA